MVLLEVHLKDQGSVTSHRALLCLKNLHEQKRGGVGDDKMMSDESRLVWSEHLEMLLRPPPQVNCDITRQCRDSFSRHSCEGRTSAPDH